MIMDDITIRKATIEDLDLLVHWRMEVLHAVFGDAMMQDEDVLEHANREYYVQALRSQEHCACFALHGAEIVGCGGICLSREMPSPDNLSGRCAYLMNIYTCPAFRGYGVGGSVVRWLIKEARNRHITKIYLETTGEGRNLYINMGFEDMPDMMKLVKKRL